MREKEIISFVTIWMYFEDIMLIEVSQTKKNSHSPYVLNFKKVELTKTVSKMMVAKG